MTLLHGDGATVVDGKVGNLPWLEYQILVVETNAYRNELLNNTTLLTVPMLWLVERDIPFEEMQKRGWHPSENRFVLEKWIPH
jgi:hypothetical protein